MNVNCEWNPKDFQKIGNDELISSQIKRLFGDICQVTDTEHEAIKGEMGLESKENSVSVDLGKRKLTQKKDEKQKNNKRGKQKAKKKKSAGSPQKTSCFLETQKMLQETAAGQNDRLYKKLGIEDSVLPSLSHERLSIILSSMDSILLGLGTRKEWERWIKSRFLPDNLSIGQRYWVHWLRCLASRENSYNKCAFLVKTLIYHDKALYDQYLPLLVNNCLSLLEKLTGVEYMQLLDCLLGGLTIVHDLEAFSHYAQKFNPFIDEALKSYYICDIDDFDLWLNSIKITAEKWCLWSEEAVLDALVTILTNVIDRTIEYYMTQQKTAEWMISKTQKIDDTVLSLAAAMRYHSIVDVRMRLAFAWKDIPEVILKPHEEIRNGEQYANFLKRRIVCILMQSEADMYACFGERELFNAVVRECEEWMGTIMEKESIAQSLGCIGQAQNMPYLVELISKWENSEERSRLTKDQLLEIKFYTEKIDHAFYCLGSYFDGCRLEIVPQFSSGIEYLLSAGADYPRGAIDRLVNLLNQFLDYCLSTPKEMMADIQWMIAYELIDLVGCILLDLRQWQIVELLQVRIETFLEDKHFPNIIQSNILFKKKLQMYQQKKPNSLFHREVWFNIKGRWLTAFGYINHSIDNILKSAQSV